MNIHLRLSSAGQVLALISIAFSLSGCDKLNLSEYWLCSGNSQQIVLDSGDAVLEKYGGDDPLMLEIWGQHVYRFLQGSFSGVYLICASNAQMNAAFPNIEFRMLECQWATDFYRAGIFNRHSGELLMRDYRKYGDRVVQSEGRYQCHKKGRSFNFAEFNHV